MAPGQVTGVDTLFATDENNVEVLHKSIEEWLAEGENIKVEPVVDSPPPGYNPFKAIVNQWAGFITLESGDKRRFRCWLPDKDIEVVGTIILVHGYGEYSARYHHVAKYYNDNGYRVFGFDHRYHGDDENYVHWKIKDLHTVDPFISDTEEIIAVVENKYSDLPYFVKGHSMGGMITLFVTLRQQDSWACKGLVLSSPLVRTPGRAISPYPYHWFFKNGTSLLASTVPLLQIPGVPASDASHLDEVRKAMKEDEKLFGAMASAHVANLMVHSSAELQKRLKDIKAPFFVVHGTADKATKPSGSKLLHELASSEDKTIKLFEGLYHELFNEAERDQILSDVVNWMNERL